MKSKRDVVKFLKNDLPYQILNSDPSMLDLIEDHYVRKNNQFNIDDELKVYQNEKNLHNQQMTLYQRLKICLSQNEKG